MKRWRGVIAGLAVIAGVSLGAAGLYVYSAPGYQQRPDFTLPDLRGQPRSIDEYDGKVVVVNFWATWCAPCRREIPMLVQAQADYRSQGLQIIGVAVDTRGAATAFTDEYGVNYPVLAAPTAGARVQDTYTSDNTPAGVLPYTVVINRDGRMVAHIAGALDRARLERLIRPLLARHPPSAGA